MENRKYMPKALIVREKASTLTVNDVLCHSDLKYRRAMGIYACIAAVNMIGIFLSGYEDSPLIALNLGFVVICTLVGGATYRVAKLGLAERVINRSIWVGDLLEPIPGVICIDQEERKKWN